MSINTTFTKEKYPNVVTTDNVNDIIKQLQSKQNNIENT